MPPKAAHVGKVLPCLAGPAFRRFLTTWKLGPLEAWSLGGLEAWKLRLRLEAWRLEKLGALRSLEAWRLGCLEAWKPGSLEAWKLEGLNP